MSLVVSCPRCGDEVTLPAEARDDALVQCPYCSEVYPLEEARSQIPRALVVVGSVAAEQEIAEAEEGDEESRLAPAVTYPPSFVAEDTPAASRPTPQALRSRRSKPKFASHGLAEIAKIVAGGALGLAIGQLILWWMPGNWSLSNRDPAGIGAQWGEYIPWIVPSQVRGNLLNSLPMAQRSFDSFGPLDPPREFASYDDEFQRSIGQDETAEYSSDPANGYRGEFPPLRERIRRDSALEERGVDPPTTREPLDKSDIVELAPSRGTDPEELANRFEPDDGVSQDSVPEASQADSTVPKPVDRENVTREEGSAPSRESPPVELPTVASPPSPPSSRIHAVRRGPRFEPTELTETVRHLNRELEEWIDEDSDAHAESAHALLIRAAAVVPFTDPAQGETRAAAAELRRLLAKLARNENRLAEIMAINTSVPLRERTYQEGMLLTGVVERTESRGDLFATTIQLEDGQMVDIIGAVDPSRHLPKGQRTIVLGVIIQQPQEELVGYEGLGEPVLYGSLAVPIPR